MDKINLLPRSSTCHENHPTYVNRAAPGGISPGPSTATTRKPQLLAGASSRLVALLRHRTSRAAEDPVPPRGPPLPLEKSPAFLLPSTPSETVHPKEPQGTDQASTDRHHGVASSRAPRSTCPSGCVQPTWCSPPAQPTRSSSQPRTALPCSSRYAWPSSRSPSG